jgi:hypothetical protein
MFRFSIRDVLWLTVVVALGAGLWTNHQRYRLDLEKMADQAEQLKRENDIWQKRATLLRNDVQQGRQFSEVEFIPSGFGLRYKGNNVPFSFPHDSKGKQTP